MFVRHAFQSSVRALPACLPSSRLRSFIRHSPARTPSTPSPTFSTTRQVRLRRPPIPGPLCCSTARLAFRQSRLPHRPFRHPRYALSVPLTPFDYYLSMSTAASQAKVRRCSTDPSLPRLVTSNGGSTPHIVSTIDYRAGREPGRLPSQRMNADLVVQHLFSLALD